MTPQQYTNVLQAEIKKLNQRIDLKILRGERYGDDSRRHRELLTRLQRQKKKQGMLGRFLPALSLF